jgi:hypothetical protein
LRREVRTGGAADAINERRDDEQGNKRRIMADRAGLGVLGFIFGGITAVVMLMACTVVVSHIEGRLALEPPVGVMAER